ncbi:MAG TPA: DivIVA domain-containing protein [Solirubrobacteraceae bacterium]|nr:DivIVA domain-containing protein [Solirubrobacteraceae bacterium]
MRRDDEPRGDGSGEEPARPAEPTEVLPLRGLAGDVPAEIRDVSFSSAMRGYDRREVDAYVEQVNRVIAELEMTRSPQSAIKHALDRVGEQTSGVLQRAREVAEELTATALAEAEHATRRASVEAEEILEKAQTQAHQLRSQSKEEAEEILARARAEATESVERTEEQVRTLQEGAEGRLRALQADIESAAAKRSKLLEELQRTASELDEFASGAIDRPQAGEAAAGSPEPPTERRPPRPPAPPAPAEGPEASADDEAGVKPPVLGGRPNGGAQATRSDGRSHRTSGSRRKAETGS